MSTAASSSATVGSPGSASAVAKTTLTLPSAGVLGISAILGLLDLFPDTQRRQILSELGRKRQMSPPLPGNNSEETATNQRRILGVRELVPHTITNTDEQSRHRPRTSRSEMNRQRVNLRAVDSDLGIPRLRPPRHPLNARRRTQHAGSL